MSLSPLAVVNKGAKLGKNVTVEPFASIERDVVIGDNCWIGSHSIIMNGTRMGNDCRVFPGAIIGGDPQDLKYRGEETTVELEDHVTVREYCTINRGTAAAKKTILRNNSLIMAYSHIAHDCDIGERAIVANSVHLAGHVMVERCAIVGGMSAVHQFVKIGKHSFTGGGTLVRKDVPPYVKAAREPLSFVGVNTIGLMRSGFEPATVNRIKDIYRVLFVRHMNLSLGIREIENELEESPEKQEIIHFIKSSERGLIRGFRQSRHDDD